jgi:hypothetical protein
MTFKIKRCDCIVHGSKRISNILMQQGAEM